jgi:hypothetical protein
MANEASVDEQRRATTGPPAPPVASAAECTSEPSEPPSGRLAYGLGLAAASLTLPGLAGATLVLVVLSDWLDGATAFAAAAAIGLSATAVVALLCRRYAYADTANPSVFQELTAELDEVQAQLKACAHPGDPARTAAAEAAYGEARAHAARVESGLRPAAGKPRVPQLGWLLATGYTGAWKRLHRANEALIEVVPQEAAIRGAVSDGLRLHGSPIPQRALLLHNLCAALGALSPAAAALVPQELSLPGRAAAPDALATPPAGNGDATASSAAPALSKSEALAVLREVRQTINGFRDDCRDGIVRARNKLAATILFTGLTTFVFFGLAVANDAPDSALVAGATFYLIGALVGLFRQLHAAAGGSTTKEEDYDLSTARLLNTPLQSGLGAIGGVVLTAMLVVVVPTPGSTSSDELPSLTEIFDLHGNPTGLIVAAVFGFTPALLITRLQANVDKYKSDLELTEPAGKASERR